MHNLGDRVQEFFYERMNFVIDNLFYYPSVAMMCVFVIAFFIAEFNKNTELMKITLLGYGVFGFFVVSTYIMRLILNIMA